ncbi:hypothetical protein AB0J21_19990 [Streptomyces sp. NPDC049954]|uniref:hypothetical protein n=1 Tax=Streptomyces sp. NPDC049954 TaxID=3155779 RepID=UPI00344120B5
MRPSRVQPLVVPALPLAVGLSDHAYRDASAVNAAFHRAASGRAGLLVLAAALAALFVRRQAPEAGERPAARGAARAPGRPGAGPSGRR